MYQVGDIVEFRRHGVSRTCLITAVTNDLGFNDYHMCDMDTGDQVSGNGPELSPVTMITSDLFDAWTDDVQASSVPTSVSSQISDSTATRPQHTQPAKSRFAQVSEGDLDRLAEARMSENTKAQTKWGTQIFKGMKILMVFGDTQWI